MITVGVDAHKAVHVAIALDDAGRELATWQGPNSRGGWDRLHRWAQELGTPLQWGIEGAWNYGRGLAQHLVGAGQAVYEVNPRWTAAGRRSARRRGKNDRLDAHAVAMMTWRESATLPRVNAEDQTAVLDLLVTEREEALAEATRLRNRIHSLLQHLDPEYRSHLPCLQTKTGLRALENYEYHGMDVLQDERAIAVRRLVQRLKLSLSQVEALGHQIQDLAKRRYLPLTRLCGVNLLTAGALAGMLGPGCRFRSDAQIAAYAGVAPLEASSAGLTRHRLNRGGNRRLNAVLYRIALTQAHYSTEARAYLDRRTAEGKTRTEAIRALKRFIIRAIWRLWQECQPTPTQVPDLPSVVLLT